MTQRIYTPERSQWKRTFFIYEKSPRNYISHDALFKSLIKNYFKEFIEAFLPQIYKKLDFTTIEFLSEEMIIDPFEDDVKFLDIVAKVRLKKRGDPIIIHVEPQSYKQRNFTERMFRYANALYNWLKLPLINLAVFNFREPWDEEQFKLEVGNFKIYEFNYQFIHLRSLDWKDFKNKPNPVSATLMGLMKHDDTDRIDIKVAFLRMLVKSGITIEHGKFFLRFFDQYLPFSKEENKKVMERLKQEPETFDIDSLPIGIEELAREEGEKIGLKIGEKKEKERIAINMLEKNMDIGLIEEITGLDREYIQQLENKL